MLVLTRKQRQSIHIQTASGPVLVTLVRTGRNCRIGIEAPPDVVVTRDELLEQLPPDCEKQHGTQT